MKLTKEDKVRKWLISGKTITQKQAIQKWAAYRLAHIIYRLRWMGLKIETIPMRTKTARFAKYRLTEHVPF